MLHMLSSVLCIFAVGGRSLIMPDMVTHAESFYICVTQTTTKRNLFQPQLSSKAYCSLAMACAKLSEVLWLGLICVQSCNLSVACSFLNHLAFQKVGCLASHCGLEQFHLNTINQSATLLTLQSCSRMFTPHSTAQLTCLFRMVCIFCHCSKTEVR